GSPSGLSTTPAWTAEGNQAGAGFGVSISTAGDVNGDGFADVIIGAPHASNGEQSEGRVYVYLGSASGLSTTPVAIRESNQANAWFGFSVATAFDVDGDGYDDVIVGAPYFDGQYPDEGKIFVFQGDQSGLKSSAFFTSTGLEAGARLGYSV